MTTTLTGTVAEFTENGEFFEFKLNGKRVSTKKEELVEGLDEGMSITAKVIEKKNGRFTNYYLEEWSEAEATTPSRRTAARPPTGKPVDIYGDAKDRRIAMESAYHSAAIIFTGAWAQATDEEGWAEFKKRFNGLAVAIYQGVQKAGRGEL